MSINIRDIAKKAQVSVATVSRALDPRKEHLVQQETRDKVRAVVHKHHYVPNKAARALTRKASDTIGMVTAFSSDIVKSPYYEGLISGIIEGIRPLHYDLKWIMVRDEDRERCSMADLMQEHLVDGIIFLTWRLFPNLIREAEEKKNMPVVLINDYIPSIKSSIVYADNDEGVRLLLGYLRGKGYKKIGMLRGPEDISADARQRYTAFKKYTHQWGIPVKEKHIRQCNRFEVDASYRVMLDWIADKDLPDVIFAANDDFAAGMIQAIQEKKIRIPEELAVAGYDGSPIKHFGYPKLTTVKQPLETIGRAAVETLDKLMQKKAKPSIQLRFSPELIEEESA